MNGRSELGAPPSGIAGLFPRLVRVTLAASLLLAALPEQEAGTRQQAVAAQRGVAAPGNTGSTARFVLQVGIDEYPHLRDLPGSVNDVDDMKALLMGNDPGAPGKFNFKESDFVTLKNADAKHDRILGEFRRHLIDNAAKNPGALVIFQFSGHGSQVRDQEGPGADEPDGWDETLVPVDSRDEGNRISDIRDDALDALVVELSKHTRNIVLILDSCFSFSADRALGIVRQAPRDLRPLAGGSSRSKEADSSAIDFLPFSPNYVTISASESFEPANVKIYGPMAKPRANGALTFYLMDELRKSRSNTTYDELVGKVRARVNREFRRQAPQVEGAVQRYVFGEAAAAGDAFVRVQAVQGNVVTIAAGAAHGLASGNVLSIYSSDARRHSETGKRLGTAIVSQADMTTSRAEMSSPLPAASARPESIKAAVTAQDFGKDRVRAWLGHPSLRSSPVAVSELRRRLGELDDHIEIVAIPVGESLLARGWDVAVVMDDFGNVFQDDRDAARSAEAHPRSNQKVFYITTPENIPLYGFYARAETEAASAASLATALDRFARQRAVLAISNDASPMNGKMKLRLVRLEASRNPVRIIREVLLEPSPNGRRIELDQQTLVQWEIVNDSEREMYVTVLSVSTNGSISSIYPPEASGYEPLRPTVRRLRFPGTEDAPRARPLLGPPGIDTYKLIATTHPTGPRDFRFLFQDPIGIRTGDRPQPPKLGGMEDWITDQVSVFIGRNVRE